MTENDNNRLVEILLEDSLNQRISRDKEHERAVAIYDIIQNNKFSLNDHELGPYILILSVIENRLLFSISEENGICLKKVQFPIGAVRSIIKDYFTVCESYFEAVKYASLSKIEAIDMGRRSLHNDGAEIVRSRLLPEIEIDEITSRGLFTLICALHNGTPRL